MTTLRAAIIPLLAVALFAPAAFAADAPAAASYEQAHAIFARHCLACHDAKEAEAELVLESHISILKGGENGPVIIAGDSERSRLVQLIEHREKPFMPPPKKAAKLGEADIALVRAWIDAGAPAPTSTIPAPAPVAVPRIEPRVPPRRSICAVAYAPGPKLFAVARHGAVALHAAESRGVLRTLDGHKGNVNDLAVSSDGKLLAAAAGEPAVSGHARLWSIPDGKLIREFNGHADALYAIAISPNGKLLATGSYDQKIILWNIDDGSVIHTLEGHNGSITDLAFRPDGKVLASASADRTVKLWDISSGARLDTLSESLKELNALAWAPDGQRIAAAGVDNRIRIWRISPAATEGTNAIEVSHFAHEGAILRLAFSADGKSVATSADDRRVKVWDAASFAQRALLDNQPDWPTALSFALDDKALIVGRLDGTLGFFDTASGKPLPPPKPELLAVEPRGVQRGLTARLKLTGRNLVDLSAIKLPRAEFTAQILPDDDQRADIAWIELTIAAETPPGPYDLAIAGSGGQSPPIKLHIDDLPQVEEREPNDSPSTATVASLPATFGGHFGHRGDADYFAFDARAGEQIVFDVSARRLASKADVVLTILDAAGRVLASNNDFDNDPDPLHSYTIPADGRYVVRVHDLTMGASAEHYYRLSVGAFPYATGAYPLSVPPGAETDVRLTGFNIPDDLTVRVKPDSPGEIDITDPARYRARRPLKLIVGSGPEVLEREPNDMPEHATPMPAGVANGRIQSPEDVDLFRFDAVEGQALVIETIAQRRGSPVDTRIEILHPDGTPVERVLLRAVRDSYITFRAIDANFGGARLANWEEMELNEYLYMAGEVVKLLLAPRGPDSEYNFYTLGGKRICYFDTSATAHALDEPCYIVEPHPPGTVTAPNGLPVFRLHYANDDDGLRQLGSDSRLLFTPPADGSYVVRVTDIRGFGGERYTYRLIARPARPDFKVVLEGANPTIPAGSGRSFTIRIDRIDGFDGPVRVDITGLPPGFTASTPVVIEAGHFEARGTIYAAPDAPPPTQENAAQTKVTATATIGAEETVKPVNDLGRIALGPKPSVLVSLAPAAQGEAVPAASGDAPLVITIAPGQMVPAHLSIERNGHNDLVTFDVENLPHGVIVADIGLNGVLIPEGQTERQIFLQCAGWVQETDRLCYAKAREAGNPTSMPVLLQVRRPASQASRQ